MDLTQVMSYLVSERCSKYLLSMQIMMMERNDRREAEMYLGSKLISRQRWLYSNYLRLGI